MNAGQSARYTAAFNKTLPPMLFKIFTYVSTFSQAVLLLNALILLWKFKSIPEKVRAIWPYIIIALLTEIISRGLALLEYPNLFLLHIYTLLEFLTWSFFYRRVFQDNKRFQTIFPWAVAVIAVLLIGNSIFLEPLNTFNSNAKTLVQVALISYGVYYLFEAFGKTDLTKPTQRAVILINFAVILYYSGSLFIFMFSKFLASQHVDQSWQRMMWVINALLVGLFQVLIFFGLWPFVFGKKNNVHDREG